MIVPRLAGALRIVMALVTALAIVVQVLFSLHERGASLMNLLCYFTIESNIFAALVFSVAGFAAFKGLRYSQLAMWRGAATVYMVTTGIVYVTLLSGNEAAADSTIPWVNLTLHFAMPLIVALDWILAPSSLNLPYAKILVRWLAFPFGYLIYSLLRGAAINWYPYPFLDPKHGGSLSVAVTAVAITLLVSVISMATIWYGKRLSVQLDSD